MPKPEKSDNENLILIGAGIIIGAALGAALVLLAIRKLPQMQVQSQPAAAPQIQAASYKQDTEFIKWYTETIVKPSIQQVARESADNAIKQFMDANPRAAEVQALGGDVKAPRASAKPVWVINRDTEGAITSIDTITKAMPKPKKETQTKQPISLRTTQNINMFREHITH